jgi:DNA mismatch repair protein MutS
MNIHATPDNVERGQEGPGFFPSILFPDLAEARQIDQQSPEHFTDLNLDQVVEAITAGRQEYDLRPFFYLPLQNAASVNYRFDVFRDLDNPSLAAHIRSFSGGMQRVRDFRAHEKKLYYKGQKQRWFLDAANVYCEAVTRLNKGLLDADIHSQGFVNLRAYFSTYVDSNEFRQLVADTQQVTADLEDITYSLHLTDKRIYASRFSAEANYSADVLHTFQKFSRGASKEYRFCVPSTPDMNHIEAAILDMVAKLYPEPFSALEQYCNRYADYLNPTIATFDREVQFYLAYLEHVQHFRKAGLAFCYAVVSDQSKEVCGKNIFDIALADKLIKENVPVVVNDFCLHDPERIFVVSGPNQGGKTTFARTFGQLHYLAKLGCPVPGSEIRLFLFDRLYTHFEKEENVRNLRGKLEDDLLRIHRVLEHATSDSILILNESFLSTTLGDALFLSRRIMQRIITLDMLCVTVTFLDELTSMSDSIVSIVSTVNPKDPALRTFKLVRKPADGLAYAGEIAEKYRLTYAAVKTRIAESGRGQVTS